MFLHFHTKHIILVLVVVFGPQFISQAQGQGGSSDYFKISGQYRVRPEWRKGYRTLTTDSSTDAFFSGQRARLVFDYKKEALSSRVSIQDARTWGDEEQLKDLAGLQVNELWIELVLKMDFTLKLGRQELAYDDHRLLGNLDWANLTRSHDAAVLKYSNAKHTVQWHLGGAFNQTGEPLSGTAFTLKNYKALAFTWVKKELNKSHTVSALAIVNGMNSTNAISKTMKASYTLGPLYNFNQNGWKALLGAYYQGGKTESNQLLSAYMVNAFAEKRGTKFSAGLGFDYLSGNSDETKADQSHNFSTLYATNHKFYGYMDYFLVIPSDTKQRGLTDAYARFGYAFTKILSATMDIHHVAFAHENNLQALAIRRPAGEEIDIVIEYKPSSVINLQAGYSMMFATKNMERVKGGNASDYNGWAFVMLKVSPTLFLQEFKN